MNRLSVISSSPDNHEIEVLKGRAEKIFKAITAERSPNLMKIRNQEQNQEPQ